MIIFKNKERRDGDTKCDVSITFAKRSGKNDKKSLAFSFSEKAVRMLTPNTGYAIIGMDDENANRIYFIESSRTKGYSLSKGAGCRRHSSFGTGLDLHNPTDFIGYYKLEYDANNAAFFIDKSKKLKD